MLPILAAFLAFITIGGVGWVLVGGGDDGSAQAVKRAKSIGATPLDEVPGIGAARKRALLQHFGSAKAVSRAGLEDLKAVDGISATMAQTVYDYFHAGG